MSSPSKADIAADTTLHLRKLLKINPFTTSDPTFPVPPREFCQTSARGSAKGSARQANETRILRLHAIGLNVRFGLVRGGPLRLGYGMPGGLCVSNPNKGSETIRPVSGRVRAVSEPIQKQQTVGVCVTITWPQAHRVPHGSNSPEQALKQHKGLRTAPLSRTLGRSRLARFLQPT